MTIFKKLQIQNSMKKDYKGVFFENLMYENAILKQIAKAFEIPYNVLSEFEQAYIAKYKTAK